MELSPAGKAPVFDGKDSSFQDYEQQVRLWTRTTETDPASTASTLASQTNPAPRQVCLLPCGGHLDGRGGVARILEILRSYFAPEAADAIYQQAIRFTQYRRADQSIDEFVAEFD